MVADYPIKNLEKLGSDVEEALESIRQIELSLKADDRSQIKSTLYVSQISLNLNFQGKNMPELYKK